MPDLVIQVTFRAEQNGDRARFFTLMSGSRLGNVGEGKQLQKYVYKFSISTMYDGEMLKAALQEGGMHVLKVESKGKDPWVNPNYDENSYPLGDMTIKAVKAFQRKKKK